MTTAYQVYATNTGNWGPDECYGSYGEWQDECGRPTYRTQDAAEKAVNLLTDAIDDGWPEGIKYGWEEVEVDEIPEDAADHDPELA